MKKKLQKIYLICYNLLLAQDLWQAYYHVELNISIATVFLNKQILKMI